MPHTVIQYRHSYRSFESLVGAIFESHVSMLADNLCGKVKVMESDESR